MNTHKITIKTQAVGTTKPKERTYDAQIVELNDQVSFFITSKTKREIEIYDHIKLDDIISVRYDNGLYIVTSRDILESFKSKYPILHTTRAV
ncbi:MAG: hypothetical protein Q4C35_08255 [Eubacteriales bacterium]|nr:hypothetical protein [Eubacteriales bacterium]